MVKKSNQGKQIAPTPEQIRQAYIAEHLKRRSDAEEFASFTENELADFIRKYVLSSFGSIYECADHNFYDRVRNKIANNADMKADDSAANNRYSVHLRTYSQFLESKAFKNLFKRKINIEGPETKQRGSSTDKTQPVTASQPSASKFREEAEGERKHVTKEIEVVYRNPQLRQQCLDKYGYQCQCCGMDFAEMYGEELGANFIEVHHLKLISTFEKDGVPENFLENLVPLCSNCHSMIHHIKDSDHTLRDLRGTYRGEKKELKTRKDD